MSRIDAMQQQQMALASERQRAEELVRIDAALQRIEDGSYGQCLICEEPIAPNPPFSQGVQPSRRPNG